MDLLSVLPGFATKPYAHILPPLERSKITTVDLITLDTLEIAKRAHVPPADVRRLSARIIAALHADLGIESAQPNIDTSSAAESSSSINPDAVALHPSPATKLASRWNSISTLDPALDALLGGGIPAGYVTEVTGESGSGKTQFLLSLLLAVQLAEPHGLQRRAIYISTEHPLATTRLTQMLECHPYLSRLTGEQAPSLQNILSINAMDLETQDHILNYQLPVAIARYKIGLVVIDSITSNYRAEHTSTNMLALSARSTELAKLGQLLRNLAATENLAIVLANQVSDRFDSSDNSSSSTIADSRPPFPAALSQSTGRDSGVASPMPRPRADAESHQLAAAGLAPSSSPGIPSSPYPLPEDDQFDGSYLVGNPARTGILSLFYQERFFTGWGDGPCPDSTSLKTPALGFFWSTQIACRIALKKEDIRPILPDLGDGAYPAPTPKTAEDYISRSVEDKKKHLPPGSSKPSNHPESSTTDAETYPTPAAPESIQLPVLAETIASSQKHTPSSTTPERTVRRTARLVFAPWAAGRSDDRLEFEIWKGGLRTLQPE